MYQAIPFSSVGRASPRPPLLTSPTKAVVDPAATSVVAKVLESPVVVLGAKDCCLGLVIRRLLSTLGVNPMMCEVNEDDSNVQEEIRKLQSVPKCNSSIGDAAANVPFPAVFIGGRYVGGLEQLLGLHISGNLVPTLKKAGALWL